MARGRMLSKSISTNKRLGLAGPDPALAWFLSLPHADIQGCLPGSTQELEMICFPVATSFFGWNHERIEDLLNLLVLHGFWRLVVDDKGQKAIYIERFGDHQTLRPDQDKKSNFIFSNGVENTAAFSPQEWRGISGIPPNFRGENSANPPRTRGENSAQSNSSEAEAKESESRVRARISEKNARIAEETVSNSRLQEASMIRDQVRDEIREVIGSPEWNPSRVDQTYLEKNSGFVSNLANRRERFAAAHPVVISDGKLHPHIQADIIQALLVGLPKNGEDSPGPSKKRLAEIAAIEEDSRRMTAARDRLVQQGNPRPTFEEIDAEYQRART